MSASMTVAVHTTPRVCEVGFPAAGLTSKKKGVHNLTAKRGVHYPGRNKRNQFDIKGKIYEVKIIRKLKFFFSR